jgi:gluconate kinase
MQGPDTPAVHPSTAQGPLSAVAPTREISSALPIIAGSPSSGTSASLVVIRGNSGSGKTSAAREVRRRAGRGTALIEQDHLRRVVIREHGGLGDAAVAPGFIAMSARYLLDAGYHVIVEGILHTGGYGAVLRELIAGHPGSVHVFFLDVSFEETVRRHHRRDEPIPVTAEQMRGWYAGTDVLGVSGEVVIGESSTLEQTVTTILTVSGLADRAPLTPCPIRCPRCAEKQAAARTSDGDMACGDGWRTGDPDE